MTDDDMDSATITRPTKQQHQQLNQRNNHAIIKDINRLRHIVQIEKELTESLQNVQPYILSSYRTMKHTTPQDDFSHIKDTIPPDVLQLLEELDDQCRISNSSHQMRVRPIPRTMEQVQAILSLGRSYSNRTSAPAGWTSTTPLIHFTTPNPLPHQLRHSALATLQLQRTIDAAAAAAAAAKEQERTTQLNKRKFEQEDAAKHDANMDASMEVSANDTTGNKKAQQSQHAMSSLSKQEQQQQSRPRPPQTPRTTQISMNLSDDESSSNDEEDD